MAQQNMTAVEWLEQKVKEFAIDLDLLHYFEQAKEMEKKQLNIARIDGINLANKGYGSKGSETKQ